MFYCLYRYILSMISSYLSQKNFFILLLLTGKKLTSFITDKTNNIKIIGIQTEPKKIATIYCYFCPQRQLINNFCMLIFLDPCIQIIDYLSSTRERWYRNSFLPDIQLVEDFPPGTRTCTSPPPGLYHRLGDLCQHWGGGWNFAEVDPRSLDSCPPNMDHQTTGTWN